MAYFYYAVVRIDGSQIDELQGVVEGSTMDEIIIKFHENGYVVRDIRGASIEDLRVEKLRRIQRQVRGEQPLKLTPMPPIPKVSKWRWLWAWIPIGGKQ